MRSWNTFYLISRTLQEVETRYEMIERITLTLVTTTRRLGVYFHNFPIILKPTILLS